MLLIKFLLVTLSWVGYTLAQAQSVSGAKCSIKKPVDTKNCGFSIRYSEAVKAEEIWVAEVESLLDCVRLWHKAGGGDYFYSLMFDTSNNFCIGNNYLDAPPANHSTRYKVYQSSCFECSDLCDKQPYNTQLLDNADFESEPFGPWIADQVKPARGKDSKHSYQCEKNAASPGYYPYGPEDTPSCTMSQRTRFCSEGWYSYQFDYLLPTGSSLNGSQVVHILDDEYDAEIAPRFTIGVNKADEVNTWKRAQFWRKNGAIDYVTYGTMYFLSLGAAFKIDNVYITRINGVFTAKPGAPNVIVNPGFETGKLAPWKYLPAFPGSGDSKLHIESPGIGSSKYAVRPSSGFILQNVTTMSGTPYLMTFDFYIARNFSNAAGLDVSAVGAYSGYGMLTSYDEAHPNPTPPRFVFPFIPSDNLTTIKVGYSHTDSIYFDNFSLTEMNTPVS